MLAILSPSKKLDEAITVTGLDFTTPKAIPQAETLIKRLRQCSEKELRALMDISAPLAALNARRYAEFTGEGGTPALFLFKGDVYANMPVHEYTRADVTFAQSHLRILSGLYGVLRPLDAMQPYRLEMGTQLAVGKHENLYQFWGDTISEMLNEAMHEAKTDTLINLASEEYFHSVRPQALNGTIITIAFKERRGPKLQTIGLLAKRARGSMADYIIRNRLTHPEKIKNFTQGGYAFTPELSTENLYTFVHG